MADVLDAVAAGGLLRPGRPVVVLLSGGRDSVCLLDVAARLAGRGVVRALHANYGLRDAADDDEALCAALSARLGVPLEVVRPRREAGIPSGNLQAWARDQRYAAAARLALRDGADVAAGHTATDQVETVLYRLAASPGRRALLGMRERDGRLVRPLLGLTREDTERHCAARGLPFADDSSNTGDAFARGRVRHGLVPALRAVHPAAEANVLRTLALLRDEAAVLDAAVDALLDGDAVVLHVLAGAPPALGRLVLQRLADRAAGGLGPAVGERLGAVLAAGGGGTRHVDLGGGLRAEVAYGVVRVVRAWPDPPVDVDAAAVALPIPGSIAFAGGRLSAARGPELPVRDGTFDAAALGEEVVVRTWRAGDRMRPLGLGGSKSLQDLFCDRRVRRDERRRTPVVEAHGEIAWVPGVATGERFRVTPATQDRVQVSWSPPALFYD